MAKKRTKHTTSNTNNNSTYKRIPPSIPKSVRKDSKLDGYVTEFVQFQNEYIRFLLKKEKDGYAVFKITKDGSRWIDMTSESLSPTTRQHFAIKNQPTLTKTVVNLEEYLMFNLPIIR